MSCAGASSHEAPGPSGWVSTRLTSEGGCGIEASILDPARPSRSRDVDLTDYFSAEVVRKMPAIERTMYANKVRNYWMLEDLGESLFGNVCI